MDMIVTIILGIVQGLTEFIPISSSGHITILQHFFAGAADHKFVEFINIGTFVALLVYFRQRIVDIIGVSIRDRNYRLMRNILLTSIPAGMVGYMMADFIDKSPLFGSLWLVAGMLASVGILMIVLERLPRARDIESGEQLSAWRALGIGVAQMFALFPGVSRSGSTIIAGRLSGLAHDKAAEYSFLASLPIMLAVTLKVFIKSSDRDYFMAHLPEIVIGNIFAFVAGLLAVGFLLRYLSRHDLKLFGWYRLGLAAIIVLVILLQSY